MNILICIPTYNESENIAELIPLVFENSPQNTHILVIDDNSPDGTAEIVEGLVPAYTGCLHIMKRPEKQGLGRAYLAAFEWGYSRGYDAFLEMDADFSHDPKYIFQMIAELDKHDVVIGSRNIKGGAVEGWSVLRNLVSKGGSLYSRAVLNCPIYDLTGGFNLWQKAALEKIGLHNIISLGFSFQVEMKYKAYCAGCSIKEIPIVFPDRKRGISKMSRKVFLEALINVWKIKKDFRMDTGLYQAIKFALTGGLGTVTNLLIFFLCADIANLPATAVSVGCFIVAGTQNYIINHKWSFAKNTGGTNPSIKKWAVFLCSSVIGLIVNISVMNIILKNIVVPYKVIAQAAGIFSGLGVNFIMSKFVVFKKKENK
jgi:dolichol-phosphate mannosyltransferase